MALAMELALRFSSPWRFDVSSAPSVRRTASRQAALLPSQFVSPASPEPSNRRRLPARRAAVPVSASPSASVSSSRAPSRARLHRPSALPLRVCSPSALRPPLALRRVCLNSSPAVDLAQPWHQRCHSSTSPMPLWTSGRPRLRWCRTSRSRAQRQAASAQLQLTSMPKIELALSLVGGHFITLGKGLTVIGYCCDDTEPRRRQLQFHARRRPCIG